MYPGVFLKKKFSVITVLAVLVSAGVYVSAFGHTPFAVMARKAQKTEYTVCIDSGHGGNDPGKIGVAGTREKEINLIIALKLKESLEKEKIQVIMTRMDDRNLALPGADNEKRSDMEQRVKRMDEKRPDAVISIHQNSYTDATSRGAQVFYQATSESGKQLAAKIQETLKRDVAPDNRRQIKANADYYLLKNTTSTMVIVECGFLSNLQEAKQLQEAEYQKKVAQAIGMGVLYYLGESGETKQRKEDSNGDENTAGQSGAVWR